SLTGSPSKVVHRDLPEDDPKVRQPDISVARERLGWIPRVERREGLGRTLDYFRTALHRDSA
ncbi:MAG TPA: SDR family NAD-dependent epimerase/dehydratase, partial [Bacteroidota bacterium]|nr:SDR family NAD-dependent epimerase/dehydratase [Bacteroidota bacterium]